MYNGITELSSYFAEQLVLKVCYRNDPRFAVNPTTYLLIRTIQYFTVSDYTGTSYTNATMVHVRKPLLFKHLVPGQLVKKNRNARLQHKKAEFYLCIRRVVVSCDHKRRYQTYVSGQNRAESSLLSGAGPSLLIAQTDGWN
jgi:hypothetical protein